jgi:hypothetical protein
MNVYTDTEPLKDKISIFNTDIKSYCEEEKIKSEEYECIIIAFSEMKNNKSPI